MTLHVRVAQGGDAAAHRMIGVFGGAPRDRSCVPRADRADVCRASRPSLMLWLVRTGATLFTTFGALALLLAAVGLYGEKSTWCRSSGRRDLVDRWGLQRAPLLAAEGRAVGQILPGTDRGGTAGRLRRVPGNPDSGWTPGSDTVTIGVHFPDPDLAFDLVEAALQNFLEARRTAEILQHRGGDHHPRGPGAPRRTRTWRRPWRRWPTRELAGPAGSGCVRAATTSSTDEPVDKAGSTAHRPGPGQAPADRRDRGVPARQDDRSSGHGQRSSAPAYRTTIRRCWTRAEPRGPRHTSRPNSEICGRIPRQPWRRS